MPMTNFLSGFSSYKGCLPDGLLLPEVKIEQSYRDSLKLSDSTTNFDFLSALCRASLEKMSFSDIYQKTKYEERLHKELELFYELNFTDYLLITWDILNFCHEKKIPTGLGRGCFTPDSLVLMSDGSFKKIKDISIGDKVISHDKTSQAVLNTFEYDVSEDLIEIELEDGRRITCTPDHEILTKNRGWVQASNLNENDELVDVCQNSSAPSQTSVYL